MNRLVVVSNRVPVPSGGAQAGGLAVALDGLMEKRGGVWFGWSGKVAADEAAADRVGVARHGGVDYATVDLTRCEHDRYYNRFANGVLWPLLHGMQELMQYEREDARAYAAVNDRLAGLLVPMLQPQDIVWVHDYQMLPMPAALRARGVRNPIGFFLHIPFPSADVLALAPDAANLIRDMLGADLIGFQTENDAANFAEAAEKLAGAARAYGNVLILPGPTGGRRVRLGVFPVEIDARGFGRTAARHAALEAAATLARSLAGQTLILGAERLDPTKGLLQRLAGFRALLDRHPEWRRRTTLLQIAATSRKDVSAYQSLRTALDREGGALNADLGTPDWTPLRVVSRAVDRSEIAGYMRMARVGLVTPLRDGMNLVAKEYVAAQNPADPGVLVLSRFAGAAQQLGAALLVNPYDPDAMAEAMRRALTMGLGERQSRWQAMWGAIEHRTPLVWGESFLSALARAAAVATAAERPARVLATPAEPAPIRLAGDIPLPPHVVAAPRGPAGLPLN